MFKNDLPIKFIAIIPFFYSITLTWIHMNLEDLEYAPWLSFPLLIPADRFLSENLTK